MREPTEKQRIGKAGEDAALSYLLSQKLVLVERNFRCRGGEIDLIMLHHDMLVFIEVRKRSRGEFGGAVSSITAAKKARLIQAAQFFLMRYKKIPACRFDVVALDGEEMQWLQNMIEEV